MVRNSLAVLAGLVVGNLAIMGLHYVGMYFYPLPEGTNMGDMNAIAEYVKIAPFGALLMVMRTYWWYFYCKYCCCIAF